MNRKIAASCTSTHYSYDIDQVLKRYGQKRRRSCVHKKWTYGRTDGEDDTIIRPPPSAYKNENIVAKQEIAHHEQFLFLGQCFQKLQRHQNASICEKGFMQF